AREHLFRLFLGSSAVEHSTVNRMVAGSNPARGASKFKHFGPEFSASLATAVLVVRAGCFRAPMRDHRPPLRDDRRKSAVTRRTSAECCWLHRLRVALHEQDRNSPVSIH